VEQFAFTVAAQRDKRKNEGEIDKGRHTKGHLWTEMGERGVKFCKNCYDERVEIMFVHLSLGIYSLKMREIYSDRTG